MKDYEQEIKRLREKVTLMEINVLINSIVLAMQAWLVWRVL